MASIDLPTFVDYVTLNAGVDKIYYVGHSQGTLQAFTGFSQNKALADKIEHFFALAPIATIGDVKGVLMNRKKNSRNEEKTIPVIFDCK